MHTRRAGRARARPASGPTRRSRSRPRTSRRGCAEMPAEGFVGANVTVPHKVAALALADDASEARPGDRRREHAQLRRRADRRREHRRHRLPGRAPRAAGGQAGAGARRGRLGARGGLGAGHGRRLGGDLEPDAARGPSALAAELGARSLGAGLGEQRLAGHDFDLIVNATTVGMGAPRRASRRPQEPAHSMPIRWARHTNWWTSPTGRPRRSSPAWRGRAGQRSSTGSRCWFARGPRRFGSGPGWNPRSRR